MPASAPSPTEPSGADLDARIAHDMRSLVNALSLALDVLESQVPRHRERALLVARRSTQALSALIDRHAGATRPPAVLGADDAAQP